jgi:inner membrane protein
VATILSHPAVPLALGYGFSNSVISVRLLAAGVAASILPDVDVIAFEVGIPYESPFGHRGFTHSIAFAALVGLSGVTLYRPLATTRLRGFWFLTAATVSHPLLDACTNGGLGVALFWPFSVERYFLPWRSILVSPIGIADFLNAYGLAVLQSELVKIWLPAIVLGVMMRALTR